MSMDLTLSGRRSDCRATHPTRKPPMSLQDPNLLNPRRLKRVAIVIANPAVSTHHRLAGRLLVERADAPLPRCSPRRATRSRSSAPDGGACEADAMSDPDDASGYSKTDLISQGFIHTPELDGAGRATPSRWPSSTSTTSTRSSSPAARRRCSRFEERDRRCTRSSSTFFEAGKVAAALCHGSAILAYAKLCRRRAPRQGPHRHRLRQRRGGLRRQRRLELRPAAARPARHALAHRGQADRPSAPTTCRRACGAASRSATATWSPASRTSRAPRPRAW